VSGESPSIVVLILEFDYISPFRAMAQSTNNNRMTISKSAPPPIYIWTPSRCLLPSEEGKQWLYLSTRTQRGLFAGTRIGIFGKYVRVSAL
jgi:hypothetical protein